MDFGAERRLVHPATLHLLTWGLCKGLQAQRTVSDSDGSLIGVDESENTLVADLGGRGHANSTSNVVLAHFCPASKYEEDVG